MWHYKLATKKENDKKYYGVVEYYPKLKAWSADSLKRKDNEIIDINKEDLKD